MHKLSIIYAIVILNSNANLSWDVVYLLQEMWCVQFHICGYRFKLFKEIFDMKGRIKQ